jgi:GntR family transcriptional regulator
MQMPLYQQIMNTIVEKIEKGDYLPGEKLPSERELAELYDVNRMTVKKAMDMLVNTGYLYRCVGKGTFVKEDKSKLLLGVGRRESTQDYGMSAKIKNRGMKAASSVIFSGILQGYPSMCTRLRIAESEPVFVLHRVRYGDGEPLGIEYTYIPGKYFPDVEEQDFNHVSLYDYMNGRGHLPVEFRQTLMIIRCPKREAKYLKIEEGETAVFCFEYTGRDSSGQVVEYTRSYLKSENVAFKFFQYSADRSFPACPSQSAEVFFNA